jgi:hypothetical protein
MDFQGAGNIFTAAIVYIGAALAAFWLAMVIWSFRDMRSRSRDTLAQLVVAVMVAILNVPGLLIYIFLRPRETLSEAYERSLEEEALLQEIEEKPVCPGCRARVQPEWQACPACHTRLKKPCINCGRMLELSWDLCPYCAAGQMPYQAEQASASSHQHARPATVPEETAYPRRARSGSRATSSSEQIQFVEGDE